MRQEFIHYCIGYDRESHVFAREDGQYVVNGICIETQEIFDQRVFDNITDAINWANRWI